MLFTGIILFSKTNVKGQSNAVSGDVNEDKAVSEVIEKESKLTARTDEESINQGRDAFELLCKKCHDAYSKTFIRGPGLKEILKRDKLPVSEKPATPENIMIQLNTPFKSMPSFHFISKEMQLDIIAFLNTL